MNQRVPARDKIIDALRTMAKLCGLREGFFIDLLFQPDDWSFVIKAHALLESIVCSLLATYLRKPDLEDVLVEEVEMSGRIEMLKALALVSEDDRRMMRALGTLRNQLVHNAKQTDFKFSNYFADKQRRKNFAETFGLSWPDPIPGTSPPVSRANYVIRNPKYAVWISLMGIVRYTSMRSSKQC